MGEECKEAGGAVAGGCRADEGAVVDLADSAKLYEDVPPMPLMALNHISRLCKSVNASVRFYVKALGFVLIHRPPALDFSDAWLFNYGVGIHLVQRADARKAPDVSPGEPLDPMDNHISFQCEDTAAQGYANQVHEADHQRGGGVPHRPALLQGPRRVHDRDLQLREPRARPRRRARTLQAPPRPPQPVCPDGRPRRRVGGERSGCRAWPCHAARAFSACAARGAHEKLDQVSK